MVTSSNSPISRTSFSVIIVGAGPVGLLTALRLGQAGIDTLVIESHNEFLPATRAIVYMPVVNPVLRKLGIMDTMLEQAYLNTEGVYWRDRDGNALAHLPLTSSTTSEFDGVLLLGQYRLALLVFNELKKYPCVQILFGWKCKTVEDVSGANTVKLEISNYHQEDLTMQLETQYLLGTDGANSSVRTLVGLDFEGFTYSDWKMIGCDVVYDFITEANLAPLNFVVHPEDWAVIVYTGQDANGLPRGSGQPEWRVAYAEPPDLASSKEEYEARAHKRILTYTRGDTNFKILRAEPYVVSQRCASSARKGRVMLAGDALHSNNPIGGLGLTGGILDAFCYGNALTRVIKNKESDRILTECADSRRQAWLDTTDKLSQANIKRLYGFDAETVASRDAFFDRLRTDTKFPEMIRGGFDKMLPRTFE